MGQINFFKEAIRFRLNRQDELRKWITAIARQRQFSIVEVNYIFCTDAYLRKMNRKFLDHDYFTDIITFDNSEKTKEITADIFISYQRVVSNAKKFNNPISDELHRVMIHGMLHLLGFNDHTEKEKKVMRAMEEACLLQRALAKKNSLKMIYHHQDGHHP